MKYRNSSQITCDVLEIVSEMGREGIKPTVLMTKANTHYSRIKPLLAKLVGNELLNRIEVKGKHTFVITEKGRMYLEEYKKLHNMAESFGMEL